MKRLIPLILALFASTAFGVVIKESKSNTPIDFYTAPSGVVTKQASLTSTGTWTLTNPTFTTNTADGADSAAVSLAGGGSGNSTRGATLYLGGNENANAGKTFFSAGDAAGGSATAFSWYSSSTVGGASTEKMALTGDGVLTVNGYSVATESSGTFTVTWKDSVATPMAIDVVRYAKSGNVVTLRFQAGIWGSAPAVGVFTIAAGTIPAALRPSGTGFVLLMVFARNDSGSNSTTASNLYIYGATHANAGGGYLAFGANDANFGTNTYVGMLGGASVSYVVN